MDIVLTGGTILLFITIFSFFYKLVIVPLASAIEQLKQLIVDLQKDLKDENEKRSRLDIRLSVLEEKFTNLEGALWNHGKT